MTRKALILGATGSIGTTFFSAYRRLKPELSIAGVASFSSPSLVDLASEFSCPYCYSDRSDIKAFISNTDADIVLNGISGSEGLKATLFALESGKDVALANKESIVMGGRWLLEKAEALGRRIIPVDSEHSAIYSLLRSRDAERLIITASGGPFFNRKDLSSVTVEEALNHPTWKMGKKITIDSASLANKGLEVIEASYLFDFPADRIDVVIHRQSIVHSMIQTRENAVYAQLSKPDMALPIISALTEGLSGSEDIVKPLDFRNLELTFSSWDKNQFPMLEYAYDALRMGGFYPIAYNAADEIAVNAFINGRIAFCDIPMTVRHVLDHDFSGRIVDLESIMEMDAEARRLASEEIDA